ncbi:MAG: NAD(P)H-dependent oxidoreductase [Patescibacteria group bacterium]
MLAISGSLRSGSYNRKVLQLAKKIAEEWGAQVEETDLRALDLPLYDSDVEAEGFPETVLQLKAAVETAHVLLVASPEYNHSIPGGLKNAIDWLSRGGNSLKGKYAAIFGASTGPYGTVRMQPHLRQVLACLNVIVLPQPQVMIRSAEEAFAPDGTLKDEKLSGQLKTLVTATLTMAKSQHQ